MRPLHSRARHLLLATLVGCTAQDSRPRLTTAAEQAAAMELGFAAGSMLAQVALPRSVRTKSFAGFARGEADLRFFLEQLRMEDADVAAAATAFTEGFASPNSIAGAQRLLEGMNLVKDRLSTSDHPDLMHVYRIGMMVGHALETGVVVVQGNPTAKHVEAIDGLLARYRTTLPGDLAQAGLPEELTEAATRVGAEIRSVEDLETVIVACLAVKDLSEKLKTPVATSSNAWSEHVHPHGFTFTYPADWTVRDDAKSKSSLLLPPGVTLESPGPKTLFLVAATPGVTDPFALKPYFESQFATMRIQRYTEEQLTAGDARGAILSWELLIPQSDTESGFRSAIRIINDWAVRVDAYGPRAQTDIHDATMRRIATSFAWKE